MTQNGCILITRSVGAQSELRKWCDANRVQLMDQAFIETKAITGLTIPVTDWIFFSSPQGASLYLQNYSLQAKQVAALSNGTANVLKEAGISCQFIGQPNQNPKTIGAHFFATIGAQESVLFPLSSISRKSISSATKSNECIELVTYETRLKPIALANQIRLVIFTSPSNVDGFLVQNTLAKDTRIIAIGETTKGRLNELGYGQIILPKSTDESDLVQAVSANF